MKKQIIIIHGGDTFETHEKYLDFLNNFQVSIERSIVGKSDWKPWLAKRLGDSYEVIMPSMPNKNNAEFIEWKLWFEKFIPLLNEGVILIGHSLGASFLAKYLSENKFPKKISGVFLVSGVFDKDFDGNTLASFILPEKLDLQTKNIYIYHSKDDPAVPFSSLEQFAKSLPNAHTRVFENRKHINQEEFPEIAEDIRSLSQGM